MNVLLTGSSGLIGKEISIMLERMGATVFGYDKQNRLFVEDLVKESNIELFKNKIDMIIHCAANCKISQCVSFPVFSLQNVTSTYSVMEFARLTNCKKVIYFSSSRVEHDKNNTYVASKVYGEELVKAYHSCYGIDFMIIRPETIWGLKENNKRVISIWVEQALNNKEITVFGTKDKELSPMHVLSFIKYFKSIFLKFKDGQILNSELSISGKALKVKKIIDIILKVTKSKSAVSYLNEESWQPQVCKKANIVDGDFENELVNELKNLEVSK